MTRGRPPKSDGDRLLSLAQYEYLRFSLAVDDPGLKRWLRDLPEGAMSDRDSIQFVRHGSAIQGQHASLIDRYAPGLARITKWPWRDLCLPKRDPRLIKRALKELEHTARLGDRKPCLDVGLKPRISNDQWEAGERFFQQLANYHSQKEDDSLLLAVTGRRTVEAFGSAISHPVFYAMRDEIAPRLKHALGSNIVVVFHLLSSWRSVNRALRSMTSSAKPDSDVPHQ